MPPSQHEIIRLLKAWSTGEKNAVHKPMPLVYDDLRWLARCRTAGERQDRTLQTTAPVHEAYLRLVVSSQATWSDGAHFFAVCAEIMRHILADAARSRRALKRWGNLRIAELEEAMAAATEPAVDLIALDDALNALTAFDPRKSQVLDMRIGGLSAKETAKVLRISTDTVTQYLHLATVWLRRKLGREDWDAARTLA
jgi:RNA polymerase sigma factor (TIGR02999 family)